MRVAPGIESDSVIGRGVGFLYSSLPASEQRPGALVGHDGGIRLPAIRRACCETEPIEWLSHRRRPERRRAGHGQIEPAVRRDCLHSVTPCFRGGAKKRTKSKEPSI